MKIVLIVLSALVLLTAATVAIGAMLPKAHIASRSASLRASPEQLFALISGPQNWRPDVKNWESIPDAAGRRLARETTRDGESITYEILDASFPISIKRRIATENLPYSGTWSYSLQSDGEITTVRITENGEVYNPVFRFLSRFVIGHTHTIDAYLRALGQVTGQEVQIRD
jgi:hypothetical protein